MAGKRRKPKRFNYAKDTKDSFSRPMRRRLAKGRQRSKRQIPGHRALDII
jgi:hypothetical protein